MSWKCKLQHIVALLATGADYIVLTEVVKEVLWLNGITLELDLIYNTPIVFNHSQSAIPIIYR